MVVGFFYYYGAIVCTVLPFLCSFCCGIWNLAENCLKYGRFFGTLYVINKTNMRLRHIFILLILFVLVFTASSCVSRVMYEDGQFDSTDMLENADDIFLLNSEINQDDDFHD